MFKEMFLPISLRSLLRKWKTLIEAHIYVKTANNFNLRIFCIRFNSIGNSFLPKLIPIVLNNGDSF
ncbi:hypothetical protein MKX03_019058 [Papaver bracteatum]|nr:hypothetical protein MKX03_019058 [Papaver bracteatum]